MGQWISFGKNKDNEDKKNILDVKVKNYSDCGFCKDEDTEETLTVPWEIYSRWLYLCNQFQDKEWGGVFTVAAGIVSDFRIPKQEISTASVEFEEELGGNGIVHSHHGMGAFHSGQDDKACRNLYAYSVVLTNDQGYAASRRRDLPCGGFGYVDVKLLVSDIPENLDIDKITEGTALIVSDNDKDTDNKYDAARTGHTRDLWEDWQKDLKTDLNDDIPLEEA